MNRDGSFFGGNLFEGIFSRLRAATREFVEVLGGLTSWQYGGRKMASLDTLSHYNSPTSTFTASITALMRSTADSIMASHFPSSSNSSYCLSMSLKSLLRDSSPRWRACGVSLWAASLAIEGSFWVRACSNNSALLPAEDRNVSSNRFIIIEFPPVMFFRMSSW